jgi:Beta xylosidase C-terminal Concanavalin A-like domain
MNELDFLIFGRLFNEAYIKCFGYAMKNPLTETESKIFCNKIFGQTGLSIGWKSVKNYSFYIRDATGKKENPSVATLDTLALYVLGVPYTTEIQRKNDEGHYPYWFLYKEKSPKPSKTRGAKTWLLGTGVLLAGIMVIILLVLYFKFIVSPEPNQFTDYFNNTDDNALLNNGWFVKSIDKVYWNKRNEKPGQLTLYTLRGDNWPDPSSKPCIRNLLLRTIPSDCFTVEVHIENFIPKEEWQQAGILLLEDTILTGKSMRLSLPFNDNFGGKKMPSEIYVQAITSLGNGFGKPEELAHKSISYPDSIRNKPVLLKNLENSALRIEKHGNRYRFLYAGGASENAAFKEMVSQEFDMKPKYIGIFAIRGFTNSENIPVSFKFFRIKSGPCNP